jgi:hypothetical protein
MAPTSDTVWVIYIGWGVKSVSRRQGNRQGRVEKAAWTGLSLLAGCLFSWFYLCVLGQALAWFRAGTRASEPFNLEGEMDGRGFLGLAFVCFFFIVQTVLAPGSWAVRRHRASGYSVFDTPQEELSSA